MLPCPGLVVLWTGARPRLATHRIDGELVLGRALIPDDRELAPRAATLEPGKRDRIDIYPEPRIVIGGHEVMSSVSFDSAAMPVFLVVGSSAIALVSDVRPFEGVTLEREGEIAIAGSLRPIVRALDSAANAEEHVSLRGPRRVVDALALRYAARLGTHARFRPGGDQHLDHFLSMRKSVRTIILELSRPLFDRDVEAITHLLETDLRFAIVQYDDLFGGWLPDALAADPLEIPELRFDELPHELGDDFDALQVAAVLEEVRRKGEGSIPRPS